MFSMLLSTAGNLLFNYQLRLVIPAPPCFPDVSVPAALELEPDDMFRTWESLMEASPKSARQARPKGEIRIFT